LVAALYSGDLGLLGRSLQDVVAEPARSMLIPGFAAVKAAALAAGALGCSISGSGPSVFALCATTEKSSRAGEAMVGAFKKAGLACDLYISAVNTKGPVVEPQGPAVVPQGPVVVPQGPVVVPQGPVVVPQGPVVVP